MGYGEFVDYVGEICWFWCGNKVLNNVCFCWLFSDYCMFYIWKYLFVISDVNDFYGWFDFVIGVDM